jgi:hypothetical protein
MGTNSKRTPNLNARPSLQISPPTEKMNKILKYKTHLIDRKQYGKLYQQSIPRQVYQLCTTQPVTTTCHLNLSHQSHHPNLIYLQRSIIKSNINDMHNITNLTKKMPLAIHHTLHKLNTINPYTRTCAKTIPLIL